MNGQQPNWEELINRSAQNHNANSPFDRESFRRDLAEGVERGITGTMSYEQRMQLARTKTRLAWECFVILVFFGLVGKIWEKIEPYWNSIDPTVRSLAEASAEEWMKNALITAALIYGFVKIAKFFIGLFRR